jgi:SSS family solute:Na+ symporter
MGYIPHVVLVLYLFLLLGLGGLSYLWGETTEEDFYLAGRGQGILVTSFTIMATYFSGFAMLAFPGWVYEFGLAPMLLALNLPVAGAAVYVLGNRIRRIGQTRGFVTPADMIADYYGGRVSVRLLVAFISFLYVLPYVVMQIKAGGHLAQGLFANTQAVHIFGVELTIYNAGTAALSVVTMLYVLLGGMRSVAWTDALQGMLLFGGMVLAGIATLVAMGGVGAYFDTVSGLSSDLLTVREGPGSQWNPWWIMTYCLFASIASILQPAQWMRLYSANSSDTLRKSALIFSLVLPICFLFGVLLVGIGGRAMYPPQGVTETGSLILPEGLASADQIVILMIREHLPTLLGAVGLVLVAVILVAIMAASMSTADSNLHALSGVLTRDVYDQFIRPSASQKERAWVGRSVIIAATVLAFLVSYVSQTNPEFGLLRTIAQFFLLALAFSCQLLPVTLDILFVRRGTPAGAAWGMAAGVLTVLVMSPFFGMVVGDGTFTELRAVFGDLKNLFDHGFLGVVVNTIVFVGVSAMTEGPNRDRIRAFVADLKTPVDEAEAVVEEPVL